MQYIVPYLIRQRHPSLHDDDKAILYVVYIFAIREPEHGAQHGTKTPIARARAPHLSPRLVASLKWFV